MTKFCLDCGKPLTGRQRQYCSDKCRKSFSRKPDKPDTETAFSFTGSTPVNVLALFQSDLSVLDAQQIRLLKEGFVNEAKYMDTWISRVAAQPDKYVPGSLSAFQVAAKMLWRIVDDFGELRGSSI